MCACEHQSRPPYSTSVHKSLRPHEDFPWIRVNNLVLLSPNNLVLSFATTRTDWLPTLERLSLCGWWLQDWCPSHGARDPCSSRCTPQLRFTTPIAPTELLAPETHALPSRYFTSSFPLEVHVLPGQQASSSPGMHGPLARRHPKSIVQSPSSLSLLFKAVVFWKCIRCKLASVLDVLKRRFGEQEQPN